MKNKRLLWPYEIAEEVGVCSATVRRYADAGLIDFIKDAKGRRRFKPEAIETLRKRLGLVEGNDNA